MRVKLGLESPSYVLLILIVCFISRGLHSLDHGRSKSESSEISIIRHFEHLSTKQAGVLGNLLCSSSLVPCQHPNIDSSVDERGQCFVDFVL